MGRKENNDARKEGIKEYISNGRKETRKQESKMKRKDQKTKGAGGLK